MKKVFVEYRNSDNINVISNQADNPIETIVTAYVDSIKPNGEPDLIEKKYHLFVGQAINIQELSKGELLSEEELKQLNQSGVTQFVKNQMGIIPLKSDDLVFEHSQEMLIRVNGMLAKLDSLGYDVPDILRSKGHNL